MTHRWKGLPLLAVVAALAFGAACAGSDLPTASHQVPTITPPATHADNPIGIPATEYVVTRADEQEESGYCEYHPQSNTSSVCVVLSDPERYWWSGCYDSIIAADDHDVRHESIDWAITHCAVWHDAENGG